MIGLQAPPIVSRENAVRVSRRPRQPTKEGTVGQCEQHLATTKGEANGTSWRLQSKKVILDSGSLPLDKLPFERTTWAAWLDKHPDSEVFEGP
jgi:hypothetical protein